MKTVNISWILSISFFCLSHGLAQISDDLSDVEAEVELKSGRGINDRFKNFVENLPFRRASEGSANNNRTKIESCSTAMGESGSCQPAAQCTAAGGRSVDSCPSGLVCCTNESLKCSVEARLNNTYWLSPTDHNITSSSCVMTVAIDRNLPEQKQMLICQVRLDFIEFGIAQPDSETVCSTDSFQVSGARNIPPVICGDNDGQHMYLHVPDSGFRSSNLQLTFNFGPSEVVIRKWKIRVAFLPCGADYLAPFECLQYITEASGRVWSFNWQDTAPSTRQLANQDYQICFRTEQLGDNVATSQCMRACTTTNGGLSFVLSGSAEPYAVSNERSQGSASSFCLHDYLLIPGGTHKASGGSRDKFCGGQLSTESNARTSQKICTTSKPFRLMYHTNGDETISHPVGQRDLGLANNVGFCLSFDQITD